MRSIILFSMVAFTASHAAAQASCKKPSSTVERAICTDPGLSAAEKQTGAVYAAALAKTDQRGKARLRNEQRGWRAGLDDCWKADQLKQCIAQGLARRTLELQAWYGLLPSRGSVEFACPDGSRVNVRYFDTTPPSLIAERGDQQSLMLIQPSGSGARYSGPNEKLWEHQGHARITWGSEAAELECRVL